MSAPMLELRSIDRLLDDAFVIPSFQRGFRWSGVEVTALLDDLDEFRRAKRDEFQHLRARARGIDDNGRTLVGDFYCMQPVVVLPLEPGDDGRQRWELIDGQQRLTTIYLIIRYLESVGERIRERYTLRYQTRSPAYLDTLDPALRWENPDAFYMHQAYTTIQRWFAAPGRPHDAPSHIAEVLLSSDEGGLFNSKVIWYELPPPRHDSHDQIDAFIRLNAGKIRLTNAELIRALFLKAGNFERELRNVFQLKMAQEWDRIEKRLQDDRFWFFIHGSPSPFATRIDYLFTVYLEAYEAKLVAQSAASAEFRNFLCYQALERSDRTGATGSTSRFADRWEDVKAVAQRLEEWEQDRVLYHLVGFWITHRVVRGDDNAQVVVELLERRRDAQHDAFEEGLKASIFGELITKDVALGALDARQLREIIEEHLEGLSYGSVRVRPLLLLFNIATLLRNPSSTVRFPFDLFNTQRWDIEHIRSIEDEKPKSVPDRKAWLGMMLEYWTGESASTAMEEAKRSGEDLLRTRTVAEVCERGRLALEDPSAIEDRGQFADALLKVVGLSDPGDLGDGQWAKDERERIRRRLAVAVFAGGAWVLLATEPFDHGQFDVLYNEILKHFGESESTGADNSIGNLTLLDAHTNRSYKNAPFPVKRKRVLTLDRTATFVPRCTTNVFLKYYSRRLDQMMTWSESCADSYQRSMVETLAAFFVKGGHRPQGAPHE